MTLEEFNSKMTLYYSKATGEIKAFCSGIQGMSYFGTNKDDFSLIWDYATFEIDNDVMVSKEKYIVDLETKQIKIKQDALPKYPVA